MKKGSLNQSREYEIERIGLPLLFFRLSESAADAIGAVWDFLLELETTKINKIWSLCSQEKISNIKRVCCSNKFEMHVELRRLDTE